MASIEERLVELINAASTEADSSKKVEYLYQIKELALNHGLLNNFFQAPISVMSFNSEGTRLVCGGQALELWAVEGSNWQRVWTCKTAMDISHLRYSPDGMFFCSASNSDKLVKIWYESKASSYSFIYLHHPAPITSLEWRRTGRFTPRGAVANVLMTSCEDNKVRIWVQTLLPDLVNFKLLPHFHLAGTIEDDNTDQFVAHWVNNKEMHITRSLETLLQDMLVRILKDNDPSATSSTTPTDDLELDIPNDDTLTTESSKKLRHKLCRKMNKQRALAASGRRAPKTITDDGTSSTSDGKDGGAVKNGRSSPNHLVEEFDKTLESLLKEWRVTTDLLFSINKSDGTLTSWQVKYLDGEESGAFRQVQIEKFSSLRSALPLHDATTMSSIVTAYSPIVGDDQPTIFMVTQHMSGTLGLWKLDLDHGVELVTRITGLPIDPSWLRDGVLIVEYDAESASIITQWRADESKEPLESVEADKKPFTGEKDFYKASRIASTVKILPQYHMKQLVELLAFGKLQRVKAILSHLVSCLAPSQMSSVTSGGEKRKAHRSRTLSIVAQSAPSSFQDSFDLDNPSSPMGQHIFEDIELDYTAVTSIKPLPLYLLLDADNERPNSGDGKAHHAHEEFSATTTYESIMQSSKSQVEETLDEILGKSTLETINKQKELKKLASEEQGKGPLTSFNPKKAKLLTNILTHTLLPGLTNVDQMHLLAVADAVAFFDASPEDLNDLHEEEASEGFGGSGGMSIVSTNIAIDSLDDRGLRFLTAMRQYVYLTRCLPMKQRNDLRAVGIGNDNLVWAFHSETQDELVGLIPCVQRNKAEWSELREFGVGWWLKKLEVLKKLIEKVAQSAYQAKQDPLDAALFYLAMKKKTLVCALLRRVNCDRRLLKLFEQDFNDPVNRKKALKNAYALLGLHRFEHAAAFFLLAGSIWDAVEVCINNLNDIQLAMILIRLYDNDANMPSNLRRLLFTEILGSRRPQSQEAGSGSASGSSTAVVSPSHSSSADVSGKIPPPQSSSSSSPAAAFNLAAATVGGECKASISSVTQSMQYSYDSKRAHQDPFLRSMAFWKLSDYLSAVHTLLECDVGNPDKQVTTASVFTFYRFLKDQPLVVKHKQQLLEEVEIRQRTSPIEEEQVHFHRARSLSSGELGLAGARGANGASGVAGVVGVGESGNGSAKNTQDSATGPRSRKAIKQSSTEYEVLNETNRLVDKYSDEAVAENERRLFFSTALAYLESGCPLLALEVLSNEDHLNLSQAQRMKFVACLHVLLNELNTLAQDHVKTSLDPSAQASSSGDGNAFGEIFHEWFEKNLEALRKICSYANCEAPLLRTMLTYCSLHIATEESLNTVRLEILNKLSTTTSTNTGSSNSSYSLGNNNIIINNSTATTATTATITTTNNNYNTSSN